MYVQYFQQTVCKVLPKILGPEMNVWIVNDYYVCYQTRAIKSMIKFDDIYCKATNKKSLIPFKDVFVDGNDCIRSTKQGGSYFTNINNYGSMIVQDGNSYEAKLLYKLLGDVGFLDKKFNNCHVNIMWNDYSYLFYNLTKKQTKRCVSCLKCNKKLKRFRFSQQILKKYNIDKDKKVFVCGEKQCQKKAWIKVKQCVV